MSDFASAVDDCLGAVPWPDAPESTDHDERGSSGYNGPREGNWEVSSSVGSFIDDRCPTVHGYPSARAPAGHVQPIDKALAHRLMKATLEEKRAAILKLNQVEMLRTPSLNFPTPPKDITAEKKKSKAFVLPQIRQVAKKRDAQIPLKREAAAHTMKPSISRRDVATYAKTEVPPTAGSLERSADSPPITASTVSHQSSTGKRVVRILGKNGEEAFVQLPLTPVAAKKPSSVLQSAGNPSPAPVAEPHLVETIPISKKVTQKIREVGIAQSPKQQTKHKAKNQVLKREHAASVEEQLHGRARPDQKPFKLFRKAGSQASAVELSGEAEPVEPTVVSPANSHRASSSKATSVTSMSKDSGISVGSVSSATSRSVAESITPEVLSIARKISRLSTSTCSQVAKSQISNASNQMKHNSFAPSLPASLAQSSYKKSSRHSSRSSEEQLQITSDVRSRHAFSKSAYRPPSVHSARSSSSVEHHFNSFVQEPSPGNLHCTHGSAKHSPDIGWSTGSRHKSVGGASTKATSNARAPESTQTTAVDHRSAMAEAPSHTQAHSPLRQPLPESSQVQSSSTLNRSRNSALGEISTRLDARNRVHGDPWHASRPEPASTSSGMPYQAVDPRGLGSQTNFAGTGWISPHPLSPGPRQPVVQLVESPTGSARILSYEEWQARREEMETVNGSVLAADALWTGPARSHAPSQAPEHSAGHQSHATQSGSGSLSIPSEHTSTHMTSRSGESLAPPGSQGPRQSARRSPQQQPGSVHTHTTVRSRGNFSITRHTLGRPRKAIRAHLPPRNDGSASGSGSYSVGFTPGELASYQDRLVDTVSRHSARSSLVQQMQSPLQPDYSAWDRRESSSSRTVPQLPQQTSDLLAMHHRAEEVHLPMPWDTPASVIGLPSRHSNSPMRSVKRSQQAPSSYPNSRHSANSHRSDHSIASPATALPAESTFPHGSRQASLVSGTAAMCNIPSSNHASQADRVDHGHRSQLSQASSSVQPDIVASQRLQLPMQSEITFGTREWENLENVENGFGGFQSRQGW